MSWIHHEAGTSLLLGRDGLEVNSGTVTPLSRHAWLQLSPQARLRVEDTRSLLWMANQNSVTPHVWTSRTPNLYQPDLCVFDLDPPGDDQGIGEVVSNRRPIGRGQVHADDAHPVAAFEFADLSALVLEHPIPYNPPKEWSS